MNKIFSCFWWRCSGALLVSVAISLTAFSAWSKPKESLSRQRQSLTLTTPRQPLTRSRQPLSRPTQSTVRLRQPSSRLRQSSSTLRQSASRLRQSSSTQRQFSSRSRQYYPASRQSSSRLRQPYRTPRQSFSKPRQSWSKPAPPVATIALRDKIANKILQMQESEKRWIEIDLSNQRLIAWEGKEPVRAVIVSTGKPSTPTRVGTFAVQTKFASTRMTGPGYDVTNVPHTMYYSGGYAVHGAYWHNRFGTPVSHGCVNVALDHAEWLFKWAAVGTPVIVHE